MFQEVDYASAGRNAVLYLSGIALAMIGGLGLAEAIDLHALLSAVSFVVGLCLVVSVHEYFDGPI